MKQYFYKVVDEAESKKMNRTVTVYTLSKLGFFTQVGEREASSAAWVGGKPLACQILNERMGHKLNDDGYGLLSKKINVSLLP